MLPGKKKIECIWARSIQVLYIVVHSNAQKEKQTSIMPVATGWQGGQSATPDSEKNAKNREKSGKNREKFWKNREKRGIIGKKRQTNREVSFTLPLLTDRDGYATVLCL